MPLDLKPPKVIASRVNETFDIDTLETKFKLQSLGAVVQQSRQSHLSLSLQRRGSIICGPNVNCQEQDMGSVTVDGQIVALL